MKTESISKAFTLKQLCAQVEQISRLMRYCGNGDVDNKIFTETAIFV